MSANTRVDIEKGRKRSHDNHIAMREDGNDLCFYECGNYFVLSTPMRWHRIAAVWLCMFAGSAMIRKYRTRLCVIDYCVKYQLEELSVA